MKDDLDFWVEESNDDPLYLSSKRKRNVRPKRLKFIGWASKPLTEFLQSVGKDTSKKLSQYDVTNLITDYVNAHNLSNPKKKKQIICDEMLYSLFGKKVVPRIKIYDLLEAHFAENKDSSEDDSQYSSEEDGFQYNGQKKASNSEHKPSGQKNKVPEIPKSTFAAVVPENIRLVYLKRSLIQALVKIPESFESKLLGSFVRIKTDRHDFTQKHSHQLLQVVGVKMNFEAVNASTEVQLKLSNYFKEVNINELSDDNFTEEECEDLREKVKAGVFKRPTIAELEAKAQMLHEDITKHWIPREITLLQKRIDRANEKGWRRELYEYLEKKKLLEKPSEQERLLSEIPKIIADKLDPEVMPDALEKVDERKSSPELGHGNNSDMNGTNGSVESLPLQIEGASVTKEKEEGKRSQIKAGSELLAVPSAFMKSDSLNNHGKESINFPDGAACANNVDASELVGLPSAFMKSDSFNHGQENVDSPDGDDCANLIDGVASFLESLRAALSKKTGSSSKGGAGVPGAVQQEHAPAVLTDYGSSIEAHVSNLGGSKSSPVMPEREVKPTPVIELSDDEEEALDTKRQKKTALECPEEIIWYYRDPHGEIQGPFAMTALKRWSDCNYFPRDFMVWKKGQRPEEALLLVDVLQSMSFPL